MNITSIDVQIKNQHRVSVFVDQKYAFSLSRDQLVTLGLKVGQSIDDKQLRQLKEDSTFGKLRDQTYKWLMIRFRSAWEIEDYLSRKTTDQKLRSQIIELLKEQGYIDDEIFARKWITNRKAIKPMSRFRIKQELIQKRVPLEIIDEQLTAAELDDLASAREIIAKKAHKYPDKRKLMAYLSRQGFSYNTIKSALEEND